MNEAASAAIASPGVERGGSRGVLTQLESVITDASTAPARTGAARIRRVRLARPGGRFRLCEWPGARRGKTCERLDPLIRVALHAAAARACRPEHGGCHGARPDGAVGEIFAAQQRRDEWHERA